MVKLQLEKNYPKNWGFLFLDTDDFHPKENVDRMKSGIPLNSEDRLPWLNILADKTQQWSENNGAILAYYTLKEKYRELLALKNKNIVWIYLLGDQKLIRERIEQGQGTL